MYLFLHLYIIVSTVNLGDVYTAQCETVGLHIHGFLKFTVCKIFTARQDQVDVSRLQTAVN